ncbi:MULTISPECIES: SDR family oxidoreductase [unclassified Roseitalea]|uniref:SDR family oxidoreductase n=1 Tax=unclassified Roseitalea TaxID=2639107 RepID=UPI00273E1EA5|nr:MULTISPECIES: SDR family oxidoreductase [unclassified Roseitalea]
MDLGLKGRKAIVCASSRGLGRGCAEALAREGVDLTINGRNEATTDQTAEQLRAHGVNVQVVLGDVSLKATQDALLDACPEPDILVNNNGGPPLRDFRELDRQALLEGVTQNMVTPIEMIQRTVDGMAERGFGRIVNITSLSVYQPILGLDLSSGARAGLTAFLAGIARSVAARNVTINNLLPGKFDTDRIRQTIAFAAEKNGVSAEEEATRQEQLIPAGRLGSPHEFGATCAFLCSAHAGYMTGRNILLDGGVYSSAF